VLTGPVTRPSVIGVNSGFFLDTDLQLAAGQTVTVNYDGSLSSTRSSSRRTTCWRGRRSSGCCRARKCCPSTGRASCPADGDLGDLAPGAQVSSPPVWRFRLADSTSMKTILYFTATGRVLTLVLNRPGSFTCSARIDAPFAYNVRKHATCVVCERNGIPVWSGPVMAVQRSTQSESVTVTCNGWLEELNKAYVHAEDEALTSFVSGDDSGGQIAMKLLRILATRKDSSGALIPVRVRPGAAGDIQRRKRVYARGQSIGAAIQELSDVENGMDMLVDPITRLLSTAPPTAYRNLWRVHYGYGMAPNNVLAATYQRGRVVDGEHRHRDGRQQPLRDGGRSGRHRCSRRRASRTRWRCRTSPTPRCWRPTPTASWSTAPAARHGDLRAALRRRDDIYRPWDDFFLGDQVYLSVNKDSFQLDRHPVRIFGLTIAFDDEGNETITEIQGTVSHEPDHPRRPQRLVRAAGAHRRARAGQQGADLLGRRSEGVGHRVPTSGWLECNGQGVTTTFLACARR
jgi:hypothetical protein